MFILLQWVVVLSEKSSHQDRIHNLISGLELKQLEQNQLKGKIGELENHVLTKTWAMGQICTCECGSRGLWISDSVEVHMERRNHDKVDNGPFKKWTDVSGLSDLIQEIKCT
uniref:Uncharacterized protein n=1 Tax=Cacopsylla melanoneura TaxID=428564 RepID=A0A8D8ZFL0_9HEMI